MQFIRYSPRSLHIPAFDDRLCVEHHFDNLIFHKVAATLVCYTFNDPSFFFQTVYPGSVQTEGHCCYDHYIPQFKHEALLSFCRIAFGMSAAMIFAEEQQFLCLYTVRCFLMNLLNDHINVVCWS